MSTQAIGQYALRVDTPLEFDDAVAHVTALLAEEGFGIVTELDVRATLQKKLGIETRPYRILGACNPRLAHAALAATPYVGVFLPCNVVVWDEGTKRAVAAMEPRAMGAFFDEPGVREVAEEASARLRRVLERLPTSRP